MKITADTNGLVRTITEDDEQQSKIVQAALADADVVALALPALCELVWVLSQGYKIRPAEISEATRRLMNGANVVVNRRAAEAGLALLNTGGDFADGVIAYEGSWLGADTLLLSISRPQSRWKHKVSPYACCRETPGQFAVARVIAIRPALPLCPVLSSRPRRACTRRFEHRPAMRPCVPRNGLDRPRTGRATPLQTREDCPPSPT